MLLTRRLSQKTDKVTKSKYTQLMSQVQYPKLLQPLNPWSSRMSPADCNFVQLNTNQTKQSRQMSGTQTQQRKNKENITLLSDNTKYLIIKSMYKTIKRINHKNKSNSIQKRGIGRGDNGPWPQWHLHSPTRPLNYLVQNCIRLEPGSFRARPLDFLVQNFGSFTTPRYW